MVYHLPIYEGAVNLTEGVTINNNSVSIAFADSKVTSDYLMSGTKMFRASTHEALATNYSKVHDSVYFAKTPANLFAVQPTFQIESEGNSGTVSFTMNGNYIYSDVRLVKENGVADDDFATAHEGVHFSNTANVYTATEYKGDGTYQTPEGNYKIAVQISGEWYYSNVFEINYGGGSSSTINDVYVVQPSFQIVSVGDNGTVSFTLNENYTYSAVQLVKENGVADDDFATAHAGVHFSNTANVYTATEYKGDETYQTPEGNYKIAVQISSDWYYSNVFAISYGTVQPTEYMVSYNANGGSGTMVGDMVEENGKFTLENCTYIAPEGYKFKAWAIGSVNGEQKQPGEQITITAETYIYAIWEAVEYNVTVTGGTASVGAGTPITKATMGTTVTLTAGAAPTGQMFDKWVVNGVVVADANSATTTFVMPAGNVTAESTYKNAPQIVGGGGFIPTVQKPEIVIIGSGKAPLSTDGTVATITADEGYELVSVVLNGKDMGTVDKLTGLKTGDKAVITFQKKADDSSAMVSQIAEKIGKLQLIARSSKTAKKNVEVVLKTDAQTKAAIEAIEEAGYTVKYKFYRSTKKSAGYKAMLTKSAKTYWNAYGKKGTMYYYKARVMVYDKEGKLVAQTELKQCKYACRRWSK